MRTKKPCELCEDWSQSSQDGNARGHQLYVEIYPENGHIAISSFAENPETGENEELTAIIPLKFCPNCGRKLEY